MADPSPLDPFALWRDMVAQMEKGANEFANQATRSDQFTEGMNKAMSASLVAKKMSDDLSMRYLTALNLPSRADIEALGERLLAIEDRLIGISAAIERLTGQPATANAAAAALPQPRRTRKPPAEASVATATPPAASKAAPQKRAKARP